MSRAPDASPRNVREAIRLQQRSAPLLRDAYPNLAEVQVALQFEDGTARPPSPQSFSYFPAARSLFRYACPCHSCDGHFDLSASITDLATLGRSAPLVHNASVACAGLRPHAAQGREACPLRAHVSISAFRSAQ